MYTNHPDNGKMFWVRGRKLIHAAREGLDNYIPRLGAPAQMEEEGGVTEISTKNLDYLVERMGAPISVEAVNGGALFLFSDVDTCFLATGFSWGYRGEGPTGLARAISKYFGIPFERVLEHICRLDRSYQGPLYEN